MSKYEKSLTVDDIAFKLGLAKQTVHNSHIGIIKANCRYWKLGKSLRIDSGDFQKYLDKQTINPK